MPRFSRFARCPHCVASLRLPANVNTFRCPSCRRTFARRELVPVPAAPRKDKDECEEEIGEEAVVHEAGNVWQRYRRWAGTRSLIFQSLLLGWTAFASLLAFGWMLSIAGKQPRTRYEEDAQNVAVASSLCCSLGGYCLFAVPLGIAAIATLEMKSSDKSN